MCTQNWISGSVRCFAAFLGEQKYFKSISVGLQSVYKPLLGHMTSLNLILNSSSVLFVISLRLFQILFKVSLLWEDFINILVLWNLISFINEVEASQYFPHEHSPSNYMKAVINLLFYKQGKISARGFALLFNFKLSAQITQ